MKSTSILRVLYAITPFMVLAEPSNIDHELGPRLSNQASIVRNSSAAPSWSEYYAPRPGMVINVAEAKDVMESV